MIKRQCPVTKLRYLPYLPYIGSGKSTLTKAIIAAMPSFTRVSIDAIIASRHGICTVDYPQSKYGEYMAEADGIYDTTFAELLRDKRDIVAERSFYAKADRDEYRTLVEKAGGRCVLVYLAAARDFLWKRITNRRVEGINADSALDISEDLLDHYVNGFEAPEGEGEIVFHVDQN